MTARDESPASSSMEEAPRSGGGGVAAPTKEMAPVAGPQAPREEERGARAWIRKRAKALRAEMTPQEKIIWRVLHESELVALNWRKQAPFAGFVLDFVSHPARLVVEVDGAQHGEAAQARRDAERTAWLKTQGYKVLRFWNFEARSEQDGVWQTVYAAACETPARARMERWRAKHMLQVRQQNERLASSSMEKAMRGAPLVASPQASRPSPPQSALRADSSSIEEERNDSGTGDE